MIKNSNILVLNQQAFAQDLERALGMPVPVTNDANCFTLSEAMDGSGRGHSVVFGVILCTGCGGGLCIENRLISGPNACAGEWGHNALPRYHGSRDGAEVTCYCGQLNCIESFISGSGLERQYMNHTAQHMGVPQIMQRVASGDADACLLWERYCDQLARALASVVNMLDPDVIVLGAGYPISIYCTQAYRREWRSTCLVNSAAHRSFRPATATAAAYAAQPGWGHNKP